MTPGVKVAPNEEDAATIDSEVDPEVKINRIIAELCPKVRSRQIAFNKHVEEHDVVAYYSQYGLHPRYVNADQYGAMIKVDEPLKKKWYNLFRRHCTMSDKSQRSSSNA